MKSFISNSMKEIKQSFWLPRSKIYEKLAWGFGLPMATLAATGYFKWYEPLALSAFFVISGSLTYPSKRKWKQFLKKKNVEPEKVYSPSLWKPFVVGATSTAFLTAMKIPGKVYEIASFLSNPKAYDSQNAEAVENFLKAGYLNLLIVGVATYAIYGLGTFLVNNVPSQFHISKMKKSFPLLFKKYSSDQFEKYIEVLREDNKTPHQYLKKLIEHESQTSVLGAFVDVAYKDKSLQKAKQDLFFSRKFIMYEDYQGASPLELFLFSTPLSIEPELKDYYANEAIKLAEEYEDISQLSLFALYKDSIGEKEKARDLDALVCNLSEQIPMDEQEFEPGFDGGVQQVLFKTEKDDPVRYTILKKSAPLEDKIDLESEFKQNIIMKNSLIDDDIANVADVYNFTEYLTKDGEKKVRFTMKQYWHDTLLDTSIKLLLDGEPSKVRDLFLHVYNQLPKYQNALLNQDEVSLSPLDLADKYFLNAKTSEDLGLLKETIENVNNIGKNSIVPNLDTHPVNFLTNVQEDIFETSVYKLDNRDKGLGTAMFPIISLFHFSNLLYVQATLSKVENKILESLENNTDRKDLMLLFGSTLRLKQDSWLKANESIKIHSEGPVVDKLLNHNIEIYKKLAKEFPSNATFFEKQYEHAATLLYEHDH